MTNQSENKNRNHENTGVSLNLIRHMANPLGWGWAKWQNGSLLHHFLNKIPFTKNDLLVLKLLYMNSI